MTPSLITFDAYSALLDFEGGLVPVMGDVSGAMDPTPLVRAWRAKQLEYAQISNSLQRERIPFRTLTRRSLLYVCAVTGCPLSDRDVTRLVEAWDELPLWPEAAEVLNALRASGFALAILSNGDEDMLKAVADHHGLAFDHYFASDQAGYYKPHPAMYGLPSKLRSLSDVDVLHVAGSATDVLGAKLAGMRCAWSNRKGDRMLDPDVQADHEMSDLSGLLELTRGKAD